MIRPRTTVIMYFTQRMFYKSSDELEQESKNTQTIRKHTDTARRMRQKRRFEDFRSLSQKLETGCHLIVWSWTPAKLRGSGSERECRLRRLVGGSCWNVSQEIVVESSVVDLGVVIDQELKMDVHVGIMTRSCFYQLRQLRTIRQSLSDDATRMLIHSFVVTRVDYCNSVLSGITVVQTDRVQRILSAAARLLLRIPKFAPVAALIRDHLHWLPATKRIRFKIPLLVSKCIHQRAPSYLQELCVPASTVVGRRNLWSADQYSLIVPRCRSSSSRGVDSQLWDRWRGTVCQQLHAFK